MFLLDFLAAVLVFGWLVAILRLADVYRALPKPGRLPASQLTGPWPRVSVLIPARNEEANIGALLSSVLAQQYTACEVIVLDDHSTDRTSDIVRGYQKEYPTVRLASGRPLPSGWTGKIHACAQAAELATGDWLLFLDADIRLEPDGLRRAMVFAEQERSDLFTLFPRLEYGCFWEALVQPIMALSILIWFPVEALNDPASPVASANGPFMLFRRAAYEAIGGHAALQGVVVEDLTLAKRIKENKRRLTYVLGTDMARLTMYESLRRLWNGWSRNFYVGLEKRAGLAMAAALGVFVSLLLPALVLIGGGGWWLLTGQLPAVFLALWAGVWLVAWTHRYALRLLFDLAPNHAALYPLGAVLVIGMIINSTWKGLRGQNIPWRGRDYSATS